MSHQEAHDLEKVVREFLEKLEDLEKRIQGECIQDFIKRLYWVVELLTTAELEYNHNTTLKK